MPESATIFYSVQFSYLFSNTYLCFVPILHTYLCFCITLILACLTQHFVYYLAHFDLDNLPLWAHNKILIYSV